MHGQCRHGGRDPKMSGHFSKRILTHLLSFAIPYNKDCKSLYVAVVHFVCLFVSFSGALCNSSFPAKKHLPLLLLLAVYLHFKTLSSTDFSGGKKGLHRMIHWNGSEPVLSHWDSHDPLLDFFFFCTITKAFLCWICLGGTHHTYLLTACVVSRLLPHSERITPKPFIPCQTVHL